MKNYAKVPKAYGCTKAFIAENTSIKSRLVIVFSWTAN